MAKEGKEVTEAEAATDGAENQELLEAQKKAAKKKKIIFISAAGFLLLIAIGAGLFFSGILSSDSTAKEKEAAQKEKEEKAAENEANAQSYFYEIPEILVNLNTKTRRKPFLKLTVNLEVSKEEDFKQLDQVMPKILDNFQVYLRELRPEDLQGSEGIYRLREELLLRVNRAAYPVVVKDVLFLNILTQ